MSDELSDAPESLAGGRRLELVELEVGGMSRRQLLAALQSRGVLLNAHAETLLAHPVFDQRSGEPIRVVERMVADLGFAGGATLPEIFSASVDQGLSLCPPDTGPYLRLTWAAQAHSSNSVLSAGQSPEGALVVASVPLSDDDEYPKGCYLRVVEGQQWLRGYRCDDLYVHSPADRFAFRQAS
ncbi:hypothetical protein [Herbiconiux liukaitaii]|uniref:hypothetical protein n=1 Tax=Herbiconiux liukaitaii TaxID=3342799 RepID=UPI0035BB73B3